jgi:hypothetical protein
MIILVMLPFHINFRINLSLTTELELHYTFQTIDTFTIPFNP